jgi:hypothetical protein
VVIGASVLVVVIVVGLWMLLGRSSTPEVAEVVPDPGPAQPVAVATATAVPTPAPRSEPTEDAAATTSRAQVLSIARNTAELVELGQELVEDDVVLLEDYAYPAYGVPSEETNEAIRLSGRLEGMMTDPVYEGKSMQGLIDLIRKDYFPKGSKVLYAHLGGVPAINAYSYVYRNG